MERPFIEKYRPKTLDDVVGNEEIVKRLKYFCKNKSLPNMLFVSPPGLGKTTICHCIGRALLGQNYKQAFIELNASDERNVSDVRERVKTFAQLQLNLPEGTPKLVFLDECDAMTSQAQLVLRRIIEDYQENTRFLLACNQGHKVLEALQSRCCIITLQRPTDGQIVSRLKQICTAEKVAYGPGALETLAGAVEGDVRAAVNSLQAAALTLDRNLNAQAVTDVLDLIALEKAAQIIKIAKKSIKDGWEAIEALLRSGFSHEEIAATFQKHGTDMKNGMLDHVRASYLKVVAEAHAKISRGISGKAQLARMLADIVEIKD